MRALALALLVLLAGCGGVLPSDADGPDATAGQTTDPTTPAQTTTRTNTPATTTTATATDTERDAELGVEGGISATDDIHVDTSDGINVTEQNRIVKRTMARVELIRGVEFESPVIVEVESRAEYRETVLAWYAAHPDQFRYAATRYEAMFLTGPEENTTQVLRHEQTNQVIGVYRPDTDRIVLIVDRGPFETGLDNVSEILIAHELVHALQVRRRGADVLRGRPITDHNRAVGSVVEGEATFVKSSYFEQCRMSWDCVGFKAQLDSFRPANPAAYLYEVFPYAAGAAYIEHHYETDGWSAVDTLVISPPDTTQHVLHPDSASSGSTDRPTLPRPENASWRNTVPVPGRDSDELGASAIAVLFSDVVRERGTSNESNTLSTPFSKHYNTTLTRAWAGDSFAVYQNSANETAYVWRIEWRSADAASDFASAYTNVLEAHGATPSDSGGWVVANESNTYHGHYRVAVEDETVTIVHEPTAGVLNVSGAS